MREAGPKARSRYFSTWTVTRTLIAVNAALFFGQGLVESFITTEATQWTWFHVSLHPFTLSEGYVWTLLTYAFFHGSLLHLVANMAGLWCIGENIERTEGRARLLSVYFGGIIAGALFWLALVSFHFSDKPSPPLIGASAGVFAVITYALLQHFEAPIRVLVYFIIPVTLRAKWLLALMGTLTLGGIFLSEIPTHTHSWRSLWDDNIAHTAHLGGMLLGAAAYGLVNLRYRAWSQRTSPPRIIPRRQTVNIAPLDPAPTPGKIPFPIPPHSQVTPSPVATLPPGPATATTLEDEVNRILDKINTTGLHSLTPGEHNTLEIARDALLRKE